jgi:tryptophan halogenase
MNVPASLARKIGLYEHSGRLFRDNNELFSEESWFAVMQGQGVIAQDYNPLVDILPEENLHRFFNDIKNAMSHSVAAMPAHSDYIASYCPAGL